MPMVETSVAVATPSITARADDEGQRSAGSAISEGSADLARRWRASTWRQVLAAERHHTSADSVMRQHQRRAAGRR